MVFYVKPMQMPPHVMACLEDFTISTYSRRRRMSFDPLLFNLTGLGLNLPTVVQVVVLAVAPTSE